MALLAIASSLAVSSRAAEASGRALLVQAILADDAAQQVELVKKLVDANDPVVAQALTAWRGGSVYILETNGRKIPFLLDPQIDGEGKQKGLRISDGEVLKDSSGQPLLANASELTPADANSKLRKAIKATLDLFALGNPNPKMRRDAVTKLGQEQNADYLPFFETRLKNEREKEVIKALHEAIGTTQLASEDEPTRIAAVEKLGELRSLTGLALLEKLRDDMKASPGKYGDKTATALRKSIFNIEDHIRWGNFFGTAFRGFSTAAVLLVAALGLAITFGLMGVINMAHGEIIMVGAYSAYVTQNVFTKWFGVSGGGFDCYFIAALAVAFAASTNTDAATQCRGGTEFDSAPPVEKRNERQTMTKTEMAGAILIAKKARKTTWAAIAKAAGISEVYCTSAALGQNALDPAEAKKLTRFLRFSPNVADALTEFATKAEGAPAIPKEPLQYRLQEINFWARRDCQSRDEKRGGRGCDLRLQHRRLRRDTREAAGTIGPMT